MFLLKLFTAAMTATVILPLSVIASPMPMPTQGVNVPKTSLDQVPAGDKPRATRQKAVGKNVERFQPATPEQIKAGIDFITMQDEFHTKMAVDLKNIQSKVDPKAQQSITTNLETKYYEKYNLNANTAWNPPELTDALDQIDEAFRGFRNECGLLISANDKVKENFAFTSGQWEELMRGRSTNQFKIALEERTNLWEDQLASLKISERFETLAQDVKKFRVPVL